MTADAVGADADGILVFERLDGGVEAVGHVGMGGVESTGPAVTSGSTGDGFVVGKGAVAQWIPTAEGKVVHGSGTGGGDGIGVGLGEGAEQDIGDALGGFDVAGGHGSGRAGVGDQAFRVDDCDGPHEAGGEGNVFVEQAAEDIADGGHGDGVVGVDGSGWLRVRCAEVDDRGIAADGDGGGDADGALGDAVAIEAVGKVPGSIGESAEARAHHALRVIAQVGQVPFDAGDAVAGDGFHQAGAAALDRHELGEQVAFALDRGSNVGEDEVEQAALDAALFDEEDGGNANALLIDFAGEGHGAGAHTADVGMVGAIGEEEARLGIAFEKDRGDGGDIRKMCAAAKGIVDDGDIAGLKIDGLADVADGFGHGTEVNGHVIAHGGGFPGGVVDGAGVVAAFLDVDRECCFAEDDAHFAADGGGEMAEELELDGVSAGHLLFLEAWFAGAGGDGCSLGGGLVFRGRRRLCKWRIFRFALTGFDEEGGGADPLFAGAAFDEIGGEFCVGADTPFG